MLLTPGLILAITSIIVIVVIEPGVAGVVDGLAGAFFGVLLGLAGLQAGMLAAALLAGVVVHRVVIGVGPRLVEGGTAARPVVLRGGASLNQPGPHADHHTMYHDAGQQGGGEHPRL